MREERPYLVSYWFNGIDKDINTHIVWSVEDIKTFRKTEDGKGFLAIRPATIKEVEEHGRD